MTYTFLEPYVSMEIEYRLKKAYEFRNRLDRVKKEEFAKLQKAYAWLWGDGKNIKGNISHPAFKDQCDKYNVLDSQVKRMDVWHLFTLMWLYADVMRSMQITTVNNELITIQRPVSEETLLPEELAEIMLLDEGINLWDKKYDSKSEL